MVLPQQHGMDGAYAARLRRERMRARRHITSGVPLFQSAPWRGFLRDIGLILATFIVGYGISALWLSPGSVFSKDHSLPRVLELPETQARQKLTELGFRPRLDGERPNDAFPRAPSSGRILPPAQCCQPNSVVQLVVSAGPSLVAVPDVIGLNVPQASKILTAAGVRVGAVDIDRPVGRSAAWCWPPGRPPGWAGLAGQAVALVVSRGTGAGAMSVRIAPSVLSADLGRLESRSSGPWPAAPSGCTST